MIDINKVSDFLETLFAKEYEIARFSYVAESRSELVKMCRGFKKDFLSTFAKTPFNYLNAWSAREPEDYKKEWLDSKTQRKVFLIKEQKEVTYDCSDEYKAKLSNTVYIAYVGDNYKPSDSYMSKFYVAEVEGELKLIWYKISSEKGKWKTNGGFNLVKKEGTFVQTIKLEAPTEEEHLEHYNSF